MRRFFRETIWLLAYALIGLSSVCGRVAKGQAPPVLKMFWTRTTVPLDSTLPMLSEYRAPPIYKQWAREVAECQGLEPLPDSVFAKIQFFQINASVFRFEKDGPIVLAVTFLKSRQTFLGAPYIWIESLIKHELLHIILDFNGYRLGNFHPVEIFTVCGLYRTGYK